MRTSQKERAKKRTAVIAAQRAAKAVKKRFRNNQHQYLRRKAVKAALVKGEKEAYAASIRAFNELCSELRDCAAVLRNARTSYESTLTKAQREALEYARGFTDGRDMERRATLEQQSQRASEAQRTLDAKPAEKPSWMYDEQRGY